MKLFLYKFRFLLAAVILLAAILFTYSYWNTFFPKKKSVKYVAYIGRYTNAADTVPISKQPLNKFDLMHEVTLKKYLKELNLPYTDLQLKVFDCRKDGFVSDSIYKEIAKDSNIVAVIDNTWGQHINKCAQTIKENNIPIIAINADRNGYDFGKSAIFTGSQDNVPYDIVAYLTKVLHINKINFISEEDYELHGTYLKAFNDNNITVNKLFSVKGKAFKEADSIALYNSIDSYYKQYPSEENTLLVLSVHADIGNKLINYINKRFTKIHALGHAYVVNPTYLQNFGNKNDNDLIIISNPTDALTKTLYNDIVELKTEFPDYFQNSNHPLFVERCYDAVEMIRNKFDHVHDTTNLSKKDFTTYFQKLPNQIVREADDIYQFDSILNLVPEIFFTQYQAGRFHSCPLQLNEYRDVIPNLFFGMEISDIYDINMDENSFTSDFYYWIKLDSNNRDAEKYIIFQNMKQNESSKELIFEKTDGSTIYKLYKVSGIFYVNYQLHQYPFDAQEIFVRAEILSPATKLKVSFDQKSFDLDTSKIDKFKITEWNKLKYYVTVDNEINLGMYGDPDMEEEKLYEFKNIFFRLNVSRKRTTPLLEIVLPLVLIGLISISLLFIKDISFENLGEVSIGVFMSIVAFSISFSASTPSSDNLTKADYLFWLTFIVVLLNFMVVILVNAIYEPEEVKNIDIRKLSTALGIGYIIAVAMVLSY
ncbi:hypothetical protein [Cytophaga aurantiaca]|uniref:hypothetical protein n=1 Tax=Cytophaga aurantiaca TaxID=29530 RepID=UPI00036B9914|nr:hypothetical protein [Cytophaga aurantiaca]